MCQYGFGVKLVYRVEDPLQLLAFGSEEAKKSACFSSSIMVYDDFTAPTHPVLVALFTNTRKVAVSRSSWASALAGDHSEGCLACVSPINTDNSAELLATSFSAVSVGGDETAASTDKSRHIGESDLSPGLVVTVVLIPIFVVTVLWLVIVSDYHKNKNFLMPIDQAERIRRATLSLRMQGVILEEHHTTDNPLASEHGLDGKADISPA